MKTFFGVILWLMISQVYAKVQVTNLDKSTQYQFEIEDVKFDKSLLGDFLEANLVGVQGYEAIYYQVGSPQLPVIRFFVTSESIEKIQIKTSSSIPISLKNNKDLNYLPAIESRIKTHDSAKMPKIDQTVYKSNKLFPDQIPYEIEEVASIKGSKQFMITLFPLRLIPNLNNYEMIKSFTVNVGKIEEKQNKGAPTFLFITGEQFQNSPSLLKYKNLKQNIGYTVFEMIVTKNHTPEYIRSAIQKIYAAQEYDVQHALIIGDIEHVPSKTAVFCSGVTDHYYRAIDTNNYELDVNGPDIGVGRLTIKNEQELQIVIDKLTKYTATNLNSRAWIKNISFLATDDRYIVAEGSHNYAIENYTASLGFVGNFPQNENAGGDQLYAITYEVSDDQVRESLNEGRNIINYSGHGAVTFWDAPRFTQGAVRSLPNNNANPFVISNACITGQFTHSESFGETWIKAPNGAVMFWGSMDNTYWDEDDILEKRMYDGIFTQNKRNFAEITHFALSEHFRHYGGQGKSKYYWETYVTLGDPSIKLKLK